MELSTLKRCPDCGLDVDVSLFGKDAGRRDGLAAYCREHARVRAHATRERNLENHRARDRARYAANPLGRRAHTKRWVEKNPEKKKEIDHRHYEANKDSYARRRDEWRKNNPERHRLQGAKRTSIRRALVAAATTVPFTVEQLYLKMSMWGFSCWMCGGAFESLDHVKPLSKGGLNILANLRPACLRCNKSKGNRWLSEVI